MKTKVNNQNYTTMKTKEELLAMSHEDLAEYAIEKQNAAMVAEYLSKKMLGLKRY